MRIGARRRLDVFLDEESREEVLAVGLINYLWPSLTLLLSVPILGYRSRWFLGPGMLVATAGMVVATQ